jgi:PQ loop repeat
VADGSSDNISSFSIDGQSQYRDQSRTKRVQFSINGNQYDPRDHEERDDHYHGPGSFRLVGEGSGYYYALLLPAAMLVVSSAAFVSTFASQRTPEIVKSGQRELLARDEYGHVLWPFDSASTWSGFGVGWLAAILCLLSRFAQIVHTLRRRSSMGLSWLSFFILMIGDILVGVSICVFMPSEK